MITCKFSRYCLAVIVLFSFLIIPNTANAKQYKLSERSIKKFKKFTEHVSDAQERMKFANAVLAIVPFTKLLDGADPLDTIEISTQDWDLFLMASKGLTNHFRNELKKYCEYEALAQKNSSHDYRFWLSLRKQFLTK